MVVILCATSIRATTVIPPTFDELVQQAETIFDGKVASVAARWVGSGENRVIKTNFTFQVLDTLKGTVPGTYTIEVLGGTVGDTTMEVDGAPDFKVGDRSLLFVTSNGIQFVPLVGIMYGHYGVKKDPVTQQEIVVNYEGEPLHSVADIGKSHLHEGEREIKKETDPAKASESSATKSAAAMTLSSFKQQIRAKAQELTR